MPWGKGQGPHLLLGQHVRIRDLVDEAEWLSYIKTQAESNAAATKKLLRAYAKQCGAELDFDAMKKQAVEEAEARELAEAERRLKEETRKLEADERARAGRAAS